MPSDQSLSLDQKISMRLSIQQLRFVRLLELNTPELEEAVERELEDNPALAVAEGSERRQDETSLYRPATRSSDNYDSQTFEIAPPDAGESLYDSLHRQLDEKSIPHNVRLAADYIIGSLDSNGYLRRSLPNLVNDMAFGPNIEISLKEAQEALDVVTDLEPYGVGARDLRECLRLQLIHMPPSQKRDDALQIIDTQFEAFTMKHTHRIISGLRMDKERVREAINLILSLNPKPGASVSSESVSSNIVVPDLVVTNDDGNLSVATAGNIPDLEIDRSFSEAVAVMEQRARRRKNGESEFIFTRFNDARDFIKILRQRQETLVAVMTAIMAIQKEYFLTQDVYRLKPMMIKDVSAMTGLDLSVISRATNNKYVATPWGIFPLRFFFSDSIGEEGEDAADTLTNRKIEAEIAALVEKEDKRRPLSDEKIRLEMEKRGYDVSRRTVAKYRDRQGIPVARLRKEL